MPIIKGIQKTTLVDYPGKIAATVFTAGCNFRCVFCHNASLVELDTAKAQEIPPILEEDIIEYLKGRTHQLEGVCVSGGEPTIHADLPEFIRKIKELGYSVKLDTNGTNPEMLEKLIQEKLVDYIAMDLKGPIALYPQIVNVAINEEKILRSVDLIKDSGLDHEFRTTVLPEFHDEANAEQMSCLLRGARNFFVQQFNPGESVLDPAHRETVPYTVKQLSSFAKHFEPFVGKVKVRGGG